MLCLALFPFLPYRYNHATIASFNSTCQRCQAAEFHESFSISLPIEYISKDFQDRLFSSYHVVCSNLFTLRLPLHFIRYFIRPQYHKATVMLAGSQEDDKCVPNHDVPAFQLIHLIEQRDVENLTRIAT